ncbi:hypothetical protein CBR_g11221 [Chara braunii]|uniref:Uncharacterized protein n=1 Tax=Chara braunii TaxID=69332 RepID=A0A388KQT5_CHABU|nr:hypothetical protein CBR_g11221 [Chara braunii]|eukprot:GBG72293.1 hypothetical protein CBR_g11221 [Chara braunii]
MQGHTKVGRSTQQRPYIPPHREAREGSNNGREGRRDVQLREAVEKCYDEGVSPEGGNLGDVVEDEGGRRFVVNREVDAIKEQWLKERTTIIIFQEGAKSLKEDLIRAFEDDRMTRRLFNPNVKRGRIVFEGANVKSYVANAREVTRWLIRERVAKIKLGEEEFQVAFKPWMTRQELKELKIHEAESNFWVMALRVQLDAYLYLKDVVEAMFGKVLSTHPPEFDRTRPKLMNVKFDMGPEARFRVEDHVEIESPRGERWKVDIATPYTDWCRVCRWYYHTEDRCPCRRRETIQRGRLPGERQGGHKERFRQYQEEQARLANEVRGRGGPVSGHDVACPVGGFNQRDPQTQGTQTRTGDMGGSEGRADANQIGAMHAQGVTGGSQGYRMEQAPRGGLPMSHPWADCRPWRQEPHGPDEAFLAAHRLGALGDLPEDYQAYQEFV